MHNNLSLELMPGSWTKNLTVEQHYGGPPTVMAVEPYGDFENMRNLQPLGAHYFKQ
jgi:hypothetical protein